jgi:tetratricopeptide (TPR) repeat protein
MKGVVEMNDIFEALTWLNAIDNPSRLKDEVRRLIKDVAGFGPDDSRVRLILERLRNCAHSSGDPREKAEILLYCAAIGYWRGWHARAVDDAREAGLSYEEDVHRQAVALWILGITQWAMHENHDAYRNWSDAREMFKRRQPLFQHFPTERAWYKNRLRKMEVKSAARPEEIWTWLNYFERSSLRASTQQVVESVQKKIREQAYPNIYALMPDLQEANKRCEEFYERAEIHLEFGLALYQMGNPHYAIELLRKSLLQFNPGIGSYHKQVVARCMLGALEWMHRSSHSQAETDWCRCIDEFEDLRGWADRDHLQEKEQWYAQHRDILRAALLENLKRYPRPLDPPRDTTQRQGSTPPPSTPEDQQPDLYHELLMKVRWDRAVADRLIEFERKTAPTAGRHEWIKRASERWDRDNR